MLAELFDKKVICYTIFSSVHHW